MKPHLIARYTSGSGHGFSFGGGAGSYRYQPHKGHSKGQGMTDAEKTERMIELLRWHHKTRYQGEWATFIELRGSTGYLNPQSIDFFAIHTWPSKDFRSISYEVKVSRGDFMKEIKHPEKRRFAESVSHESYFVTPIALVRPDEVPECWGLMTPDERGRRLKIISPATRRYKVNWPMSFAVSIASRVADPAPTQQPLWAIEPSALPA